MKKMGSKIGFLLFAIVLAAFLLAGIIFHDFVFVNLLKPLALVLWALFRLLAVVDQRVYWSGLIFALFCFILTKLPSKKQPVKRFPDPNPESFQSDYTVWRQSLSAGLVATEQRDVIRSQLKELVISAMSVDTRTDPLEVRAKLESGELKLPDNVAQVVLATSQQVERPLIFVIERMNRWIYRLVPGWMPREAAAYLNSIEETLQWIENTLEMTHD
jgi:hypothetical protein